ncbi:uncharacterized protein TOT_010000084 [Theileria orientalis strain Shintoku]|uniref:Anonymous antigen-1 n=1 Tax=Theileria orientalis strain Shintoku TaxID=869250 RepID=J7MGM9_THEOR|nr:uncharacterized protein TOT_010000084 [Theileria orientalis strain Shintoku]BAM38616.1 uncharacterized protein TOT_010000084 [Theileria orientalis strain Shintoku]|eukprot:XP_009688917.1 uncharacterized protein TOT_010000084 [Theileria orientalis strain Shintoku]
MAVGRMRRAPDSGVANAVSSIIEHQKFKKMLVFGLRSLSDLCNPSLQLYMENAVDAMNRNVVTGILSAVQNFGDDEDLILCSSIIMAAMSEGCVEYKDDPSVVKKLVTDGGPKVVEKILETNPNDEDVLDNCFKFLENVSSLNVLSNKGVEFVPHLCASLGSVKTLPVANRLVLCLANLSQGNEVSVALKTNQGVQSLLDMCNKFVAADNTGTLPLVENCFRVLKSLSQLNLIEQPNLEGVIMLIEASKDSNLVLSRASDVIKSVVDTTKLSNSLSVLEKSQYEAPEYKVAVNTLRCLSYISTIPDTLAKGGVIPILVNLVKNSAAKLSTNGEQIVEVLFGASRMLASISASSTEYGKQVLSSKGLDVLVNALSQSSAHPRAVCGISSALLQLLKYEPNSFGNAVSVALPILYQLSEDQTVSASLVEFLSASSQYSELEMIFVQNKVLEILSTCCQYHTSNLPYQFNVVSILNRFSRFVENLKLVSEYGGLQGITYSLAENYKDPKYCLEVLNLLSVFSATTNASQYLTTGDYLVADVILELMLHYKDNEAVIELSVKILEVLLTEKDVEKYAQQLLKVLPNSVQDPEDTFKALAALTGLHKISRLRPHLSKYNVLTNVMKAVTEWVDVNKGGEWVKQRTNLTKAALSCVVVCENRESMQEMLLTVSELACLPQVKKVIDLEPTEDNFLLHCTGAMVTLCGMERQYEEEEMHQAVESINRVMKRHQDVRQAQASLLEALNKLIEQAEKLCIVALLTTACLAGIVNYLSSVPMYLNLQLLGIGLIYKCSQLDEEVLEVLKKCNCFQLLRVVNRMHTKSKKLRAMVGSLISLLMPADALETELDQLLKDLTNYVNDKDYEGVHTCLVSINQLLVSKDAVKVAVKLNMAPPLMEAFNFTLKNSALFNSGGENLFEQTLLELSLAGTNMLNSRIGLVYATKNNFVSFFLTLFATSASNQKGVFEDGVVNSLDALVTLFKHDVANIDVAFKEDLLAKLSTCFTKVLNSPNIVSSMCKCLGALCASPGKVDKLLNNSDFLKFSNYLVNNLDHSASDFSSVLTSLTALDELLSTKYQPLIEYFDNNTKVLPNLFTLLDVCYNNPEAVAKVCSLISYFDKKLTLKRLTDLRKFLEVVSKALTTNKGDADAVVALLTLLVQLLDDSNKEVFKGTSVVESISSVMMLHFENDTVTKLGGVLFGFLGAEVQISAMMRNVIKIVETKEENMGQKVDKLCLLLSMYLSSSLKNRGEALKHTEPFLTSLNQCVSYLADNSNLVFSTSCVSRKLCDSAFEDHEDSFGAWAVTSTSNMSTIASLVKTEYGYSNAKFLTHAFRVFTACVYNKYTAETMLAESEGLMVKTVQVLERYQENAELVSNVLEYLLYLSNAAVVPESSPNTVLTGVSIVLSNVGGPVELVTNTMMANKANDALVILGLKLLSNLVSASTELDKKEVASSLETCERLCKITPKTSQSETPEQKKSAENRYSYYLQYFNSAFSNGYLEGQMTGDRVVNMLLLFEANGMENVKPVPYALFVLNAAVSDLLGTLEKMGGVRSLIDMFEKLLFNNKPLSREELIELLTGINDSMTRDPLKAVLVLKDLLPRLLKTNEELLTTDKEVVDLLLTGLVTGAQVKGVGRILHSVEYLIKYLETVKKLSPELVKTLLDLMNKDLPKKKTCQTVYENLQELLGVDGSSEAEPTNYSPVTLKDVLLMEDYKFVLESLSKYNSRVLKGSEAEAKDFGFGCKCVDLWSKCAENPEVMAKTALTAVMISAMGKQTDLLMLDSLVQSMCTCCKTKDQLLQFVSNKELVSTVDHFLVKVYQRRLVTTGSGADEKTENLAYENVLFNTMLLVDLTAVNRKVYLKTNVIPSLMDVWSLYEQGKYSNQKILRQVFRSLRKVVSEENVQLMMKCKLVSRVNKIFSELISTKEQKKSTQVSATGISNLNEAMIPDALFLIGSMAIILEIKEEIVNILLLDKIIELLERYIKMGSSNAIVTNCCLALANICVDYKPASDKFMAMKGPQLNLDAFVNFKSSYEVINGASILLCNVLYKNDRLKEIYGKNGTPAALVECLLNFVSATDATGLRCMESLFKAVSNLGLFAKNLQYFVEAQMETAYKKWLTKVTHTANYDMQLVRVGLNCLSNLVVEKNQDYMKKFGVFMEDLVLLLNLDVGDPKLVFLTLDILNNLCRSKDNCVKFIDLDGIFAAVKNMRKMNYDLEVIVTGIHLFSHLAFDNGTVKLLEIDIFSFLLEILTQATEINDVLISSLRCLRRLIQSPEMVYLLCSQDGLDTLIKCSNRMKDQSSVLVESIRVVLGMLYYTDPYAKTSGYVSGGAQKTPLPQATDDASTVMGSDSDEDMGWENIGMNVNNIIDIIKFSCHVAKLESCVKMSRLQSSVISICVYFMSCGLCGEELALNGFSNILCSFVTSFCQGNASLSLLAVSALEASLNYPLDLRSNIVTKEVLKKYRDLSHVISDKQLKARCSKLLELVGDSEIPSKEIHKFDLAISDWNVDPYPNGVHDLAESMKEFLRTGGKFQLVVPTTDSTKKKPKKGKEFEHTWRASQDLSNLEWIFDPTQEKNKIAFMRVRNISRGLKHDLLIKANEKDYKRITNQNTLVLLGSATDEYPQGFALPMVFKSNKDRELVAEAFIQWRDAASYN